MDGCAAKFQDAFALHQRGSLSEAKELYDQVLLTDPRHFHALHLSGVIEFQIGDFKEAERFFLMALEIEKNFAPLYLNYALTLRNLRRNNEELDCYDKAISIKSDYDEAFYNRGVCFQQLSRIDEALKSYGQALLIKPDYAEALYNRGIILHQLKSYGAALESYGKAISIKSDYVEALCNKGISLNALNRMDEALQAYDQAIVIQPDFAEAFFNRGNTLHGLNRFDEALTSYESAIQIKCDYLNAQTNQLFSMSYSEDKEPIYRLGAAKRYGGMISALAAKKRFTNWPKADVSDKLRIGFVSGDFENHPVGYFLESFLSKIDVSCIELFAYSNTLDEDDVTARLKKSFCSYKTILGLGDEETSTMIHADGIQILIHLSGHTFLNRLPVFAFKPAPVQASWLGYWATTGVSEIDYLIGDPFVTPLEEEGHFSERIKRLPDTYICFTQPQIDITVQELPALKTEEITFGCFNNLLKVNNNVIFVWSKILNAIDGSRLFLKAGQLDNPDIANKTLALFDSFGISKDRLLFEGRTDLRDYFKSYNKIDIALDPFPFPGGATSVQALWMGVPVLTKKGNRFISHNGETIAHNSGQSDWIARDENDYIEKAVRFSSDLQALANLRMGLRSQVLASPLFDAQRFARNFETAMYEIWDHYKSN